MKTKLRKALKIVRENNKKNNKKAKKAWYYIGRYLMKGHKIANQHRESSLTARRTYKYYKIGKGNWEGPSPRQLGKLIEKKFLRVLKRREQSKRETLLEPGLTPEGTPGSVPENINGNETITQENSPEEQVITTAPQIPQEEVRNPQALTIEALNLIWDDWDEVTWGER